LACAQVAQVAGITSLQAREAIFESGLNDRYEVGALESEEFHAEFSRLTSTTTGMDEFALAFSDIFEVHTRTFPIVASLCSTGNRLGILSNTCAVHWEFVLERFPSLAAFFNPMVTSYAAKSMKPQAAIYERATSLAGVAPDEIFFTDDREENVQGAIEYGWHARLFSSANQLADDLDELGVAFNRS
jgi:FMN phosphatase YigB (HAD superfamily)